MDVNSFEELNPDEQARVFRQSSFKERAELIRHSHDPQALTRALSHEELYLLTREMDMEDRSEVIRYAALPQLLFIADVDCWKKGRLDADGFVVWMETLLAAGDQVYFNWSFAMDPETIIAGFQKIIQVIKPDREYAIDEILGDKPYFTLDEMYFIAVKEENMDTVRRALQVLYENHRGRYVSLLESIIVEMEDEIEEEAHENRERRLSERGFPDYESARKIYRPISKEEFAAYPKKAWNAPKDPHSPAPNYPVLWSEDRLFLDEVLLLVPKDRQDLLQNLHEELAWVSNKVLAADSLDFTSEERVRRGIERARGFISLGLQSLSGGDLPAALKILEEHWCENIFRCAMRDMLELKEKALAVVREYWKGNQLGCLEFLNPPYEFVFLGLLRPVPQCFDGEVKENVEPLRDFRRLEDLERAGRSLVEIENIFRALATAFPAAIKTFVEYYDLEGEISGTTVLGTLFARHILNGKPSFKKLTLKELALFMEKAFDSTGTRRFLRPEFKEAWLRDFAGPADREKLRGFMGFVFEHIEEEFRRLDFSKAVEPKFISSVWIRAAESTETGASEEKSPKEKKETRSVRKRKA